MAFSINNLWSMSKRKKTTVKEILHHSENLRYYMRFFLPLYQLNLAVGASSDMKLLTDTVNYFFALSEFHKFSQNLSSSEILKTP